jgi:hypothetical protein
MKKKKKEKKEKKEKKRENPQKIKKNVFEILSFKEKGY